MKEPTGAHRNPLGQPIGPPLPDWTPRQRPPRTPLEGRLCRLEPLDAATHAQALHEEYAADPEGRNWTYLPYGPIIDSEWPALRTAFERWLDPANFDAQGRQRRRLSELQAERP